MVRKIPMDEPAPTISGTGGRGRDVFVLVNGNQPNAARREIDEPAPTIRTAATRSTWEFRKRDVREDRKAAGAGNKARSIDAPAPTIDTGIRQAEWAANRPATTVTADPRIARPGHHGSADERDPAERSMTDSVPVTVEQAAALQSFPPDWPWQGSKTKRHEQVGNAVPPLMARVILEALRPHTPKESE